MSVSPEEAILNTESGYAVARPRRRTQDIEGSILADTSRRWYALSQRLDRTRISLCPTRS